VGDQRPGEELAICTPDGREQAVPAGSIERIGAVDLALLRFRNPGSQRVAQRKPLSSAAMDSTVAVAGYPLVASAVPKRLLRFLEGRVLADAGADIPNGHQRLYDRRTLRGMSGGAVLNSRGQRAAIHGRSETDTVPSEETDVSGSRPCNVADLRHPQQPCQTMGGPGPLQAGDPVTWPPGTAAPAQRRSLQAEPSAGLTQLSSLNRAKPRSNDTQVALASMAAAAR